MEVCLREDTHIVGVEANFKILISRGKDDIDEFFQRTICKCGGMGRI